MVPRASPESGALELTCTVCTAGSTNSSNALNVKEVEDREMSVGAGLVGVSEQAPTRVSASAGPIEVRAFTAELRGCFRTARARPT
jgi:hypothetical protein